jgi:hypothetical protein
MKRHSISSSNPETPIKPAPEIYGEGEMAQLTRRFDWTKSSIGPVGRWPEALLNTVNLLLASRHPMFLWWGPELIQFYNDAYRPSIGFDKHPKALGQRGADCWGEIWLIIGPQIEAVMGRGEATWHENQLVPILRNGRMEDVYWTYGYSPIRDSGGGILGVLVVCTETTKQVVSERKLRISEERLRLTQRAARIGSWEFDLDSEEYVWSHEVFEIFDVSPNLRPTQRNVLSLLFVSTDRDSFVSALHRARTKNKEFAVRFRIAKASGEVHWIEARGRPYFNLGKPLILGVFIDITETLEAESYSEIKSAAKKTGTSR